MLRGLIGALVLAGAMLSPGAALAQTPISDRSQVQAGYMIQTVPGGSKGQIQISLHASF